MTSPISCVAVGEAVGQGRGVGQQLLDGAALALEHLDQVHAELVDLLGRERLEQRLEAVEELGQVERRQGLLDRERVAFFEPGAGGRGVGRPAADAFVEPVGQRCPGLVAGLEREVAVADQVEEADLRPEVVVSGTSDLTAKVTIAMVRS